MLKTGTALVLYYDILTKWCIFLTRAFKIEGISMQHFLVTSHFTFTVKSVMALKVIFTTLKKNVSFMDYNLHVNTLK